jgi:hypothetical protein
MAFSFCKNFDFTSSIVYSMLGVIFTGLEAMMLMSIDHTKSPAGEKLLQDFLKAYPQLEECASLVTLSKKGEIRVWLFEDIELPTSFLQHSVSFYV